MTIPSEVLQDPSSWIEKPVRLSGCLRNVGYRTVVTDIPKTIHSDQDALNAYHRGILLRFPGLLWALMKTCPLSYGGSVWEIKGILISGIIRLSTVKSHRFMIDAIHEIVLLPESRPHQSLPSLITPEFVRHCISERVEMAKRQTVMQPELASQIPLVAIHSMRW